MDVHTHTHRPQPNPSTATAPCAGAKDEARQRKQKRWQEISFDEHGYVQRAPASLAAAAARALRAGEPVPPVSPYVPPDELRDIDDFAVRVVRDRERVRTARLPASTPAPWYTHTLREAIAAAVPPLVPGQGIMRDELERRFVAALTYVNALDNLATRGQTPTAHDVSAIAALLR